MWHVFREMSNWTKQEILFSNCTSPWISIHIFEMSKCPRNHQKIFRFLILQSMTRFEQNLYYHLNLNLLENLIIIFQNLKRFNFISQFKTMKAQEVLEVKKLQETPKLDKIDKSNKGSEFIWKVLFVIVTIFSAILFNKIYLFQTLEYFQGIRKGNITELILFGVPFGALFIGLQNLLHYLLDHKCETEFVDPNKFKTKEARQKRAYTLVKWGFSAIYYTITAIAAFMIVWQTSYMPTWLGGSGYCTDNARYTNSFDQANIEMKIFYVLQFGKHLGRLVSHLFIRAQGKFYEFALHHGLATSLILFSYLSNLWLIGIFVLFIHDLSDIFLIFSRGSRDLKMKNKKLLFCMDILGGTIWVFCRIFLLAHCCVYSIFNTVYMYWTDSQKFDPKIIEMVQFPTIFIGFMLLALLIMQIFWTYFIGCSFIYDNVSQKLLTRQNMKIQKQTY